MTITLRAGVLNSGIQQNGTEFLTVDTSNNVSLSAALPVLSGGTGVTTKTGTGAVVLGTSPTITGATITVAATAAPAFSAYKATNQSITSATFTKMVMDTEDFDTNSNFDSTTNYRFTPTVAGYYQVTVQLNPNTTTTITYPSIYKNGAAVKNRIITATNAAVNVTALIYMNGSSDYLEFYGYLTGTTPATVGGSTSTYFQAFLARSA